MRITIEIEGKDAESFTKEKTVLPGEAVDAGTAASQATAEIFAEDTGGPPAWLLEAVGRSAEEDMISAVEIDSEDAGAGPAD